jgi:hypothetical protein
LWRGQEKSATRPPTLKLRRGESRSNCRAVALAKADIGNTRKLFDEPTTQKAPALKGCVLARDCCVAALERCPCIALRAAPGIRRAGTQRRLLPPRKDML